MLVCLYIKEEKPATDAFASIKYILHRFGWTYFFAVPVVFCMVLNVVLACASTSTEIIVLLRFLFLFMFAEHSFILVINLSVTQYNDGGD